MPDKNALTHFDGTGRPIMVDVSGKAETARFARASGFVRMSVATLVLVESGGNRKGDVRSIAVTAGIMAAKRTSDLIPLCHPLFLSGVTVSVEIDRDRGGLEVIAEAKTTSQTGVEMEALTAVSVACLTIYDMLKAAERGMVIEDIKILAKSGGASGDYRADGDGKP